MKFLVVLAVAVACAYAAELRPEEVPIVKSAYDSNPDGSYAYNFESGNGIVMQAQGELKNANTDNAFVAVKGAWKYTAPDGTPVQFEYVADENGYQPQSSLLPVAPEIPVAIARSLEYIRSHPSKETVSVPVRLH